MIFLDFLEVDRGFNVALSACQTSGQWQQVLSLLGTMEGDLAPLPNLKDHQF